MVTLDPRQSSHAKLATAANAVIRTVGMTYQHMPCCGQQTPISSARLAVKIVQETEALMYCTSLQT